MYIHVEEWILPRTHAAVMYDQNQTWWRFRNQFQKVSHKTLNNRVKPWRKVGEEKACAPCGSNELCNTAEDSLSFAFSQH